jgi:predicted CXXCH cytochrome family protein
MAESCAICHEPHASDFAQHLRAETNNLCLTCHGAASPEPKDGVVTLFSKITLPAGVLENIPRLPVTPANAKGHPIMQHPFSGANSLVPDLGNLSCASCHSPHSVKQEMNKELLATEGNRASDLCLTCHGDGKK